MYVSADEVLKIAQVTGATPYDIPSVEMGHNGELCSFDAFLKKYQLTDPALQQLASIVCGADTSRLDLAPQAAGLLAISLGLSHNFPDDHEMLKQGIVIYMRSMHGARHCKARRTIGRPLGKHVASQLATGGKSLVIFSTVPASSHSVAPNRP